MADHHLVCVVPFGKYSKGQLIDEADVAAVMKHNEGHVVRAHPHHFEAPPAPVAVDAPTPTKTK